MKKNFYESVDMPVFPSFKYIKPYLSGKKVLDVGCGTGRYLEQFSKDSVGLEISAESVNFVKNKGLKVYKCDLDRGFPVKIGEFDAVFASHVIEHVRSPYFLLQEASRVLNKKGLVILGFPVESSIVRIFGDKYFGDHPDHLYSFSIEGISKLLIQNGFKVEKIFVDLNFVGRYQILNIFLDFINRLPLKLVLWFSNAVWVVGRKTI